MTVFVDRFATAILAGLCWALGDAIASTMSNGLPDAKSALNYGLVAAVAVFIWHKGELPR